MGSDYARLAVLGAASLGFSGFSNPLGGWSINPELHARRIIPAPPKPLTKRQKRRLRGKART